MAEVTTDHETIRRWAEKKGGKPAAVLRTHTRSGTLESCGLSRQCLGGRVMPSRRILR